MTIVVVGIIAIPLSILLSEHVQAVFKAEDYAVSLNLGRLEMETVQNTPYANVTTTSFSGYKGYGYDLDRTVTYAQGNAGTAESVKLVSINVKKGGTSTVLANLVTYLVKNVSYGL